MTEEFGRADSGDLASAESENRSTDDTSKVKLLGYSERGMINAICDDIYSAESPTLALEKFLSWCCFPFQTQGFDLQLISGTNGSTGAQDEGKNLIIVASVEGVLQIRIFDSDGKLVFSEDEKALVGKGQQVEQLKKQLEMLWPPHQLTRCEKQRIVRAVRLISAHSQMDCVPSFSGITKATLLVEQSFKDFGDLDLLLLLEHQCGKRQAVLVEAKVATGTTSPKSIGNRWNDFLGHLIGDETVKSKRTSNLFVQVYRKMRLIRHLHDRSMPLDPDDVAVSWGLGKNRIVKKAADFLAEYAASPWYVVLVPDREEDVAGFFESILRPFDRRGYNIPEWEVEKLGYITWAKIEDLCKSERIVWKRTMANFEWNEGQVYQTTPRSTGGSVLVRPGKFYFHAGQLVYVTGTGRRGSRVIPITDETSYFPESDYVQNARLDPVDGPISPDDASRIASLRPITGSVYKWDPPDGVEYRPSKAPMPAPPKRVKIKKGSSLTSAVWVVDDQNNTLGDDFKVFTDHIRRG